MHRPVPSNDRSIVQASSVDPAKLQNNLQLEHLSFQPNHDLNKGHSQRPVDSQSFDFHNTLPYFQSRQPPQPVFLLPGQALLLQPLSGSAGSELMPNFAQSVSSNFNSIFHCPSRIPDKYQTLFQKVCPKIMTTQSSLPDLGSNSDQTADTGLVYALFKTSALSDEILATIWTTVNRTCPGHLTKQEFFAALALIAVAQETGEVSSIEYIENLPILSVPNLLCESTSIIPPDPFHIRRNSKDFYDLKSKSSANRAGENFEEDFAEFQDAGFGITTNRTLSKPSDSIVEDRQSVNEQLLLTETQSSSIHNPTISDNMSNLYDKYAAFREIETSEQNSESSLEISWHKIITICEQLLKGGVEKFQKIECPETLGALLKLDTTKRYLLAMAEIFCLIQRISLSSSKNDFSTSDDLQLLIDNCKKHWLYITKIGETILNDSGPENQPLDSGEKAVANSSTCGICLVDFLNLSCNPSYISKKVLSYGGRSYHAPCANFWLNKIDVLLPDFKTLSLLD